MVFYTFGIFLPEIITATHWSATGVAASMGPALLVAALSAPLGGWAIDRLGTRLFVLIGAPSAAAGFLILGFLPASSGQFAVAMAALFLLYFAGSPVPYARLVAGWFGTRRGGALGVMFAFGSLGMACWPQFAAYLISEQGWRRAYVIMGASASLMLLFSGLFLVKDPIARDANEDWVSSSLEGLSVTEAAGTSRFWKLAATFFVITAVLAGTAVMFPVILRMRGAGPQTAASVMSAIALGMFAGRLGMGFLIDRFFSPTITIFATCISLLSFTIIASTANVIALFIAAALLGLSLGSEYSVAAYMTSRAFGMKAFGATYGLMITATSFGSAVGPAVLGTSIISGIGIRSIFIAASMVLAIPIIMLNMFKEKDFPFS